MTLEAIKEAIGHLPEPDRRKLADWLADLEEHAWDEQIERDFSPGGPGLPLLEQVKQEIEEGKARRMEEGFAARRKSRV
jgi:hypothetical protein